MRTCIVDTGILYALFDAGDSWHERAVKFANQFPGKLVVPQTVIPEAAYLINKYLGPAAEQHLISALVTEEFTLEALNSKDLRRIAVLLRDYADLTIGTVEASVIALAERLKTHEIATTDRRHFSVIKLAHAKPMVLLP